MPTVSLKKPMWFTNPLDTTFAIVVLREGKLPRGCWKEQGSIWLVAYPCMCTQDWHPPQGERRSGRKAHHCSLHTGGLQLGLSEHHGDHAERGDWHQDVRGHASTVHHFARSSPSVILYCYADTRSHCMFSLHTALKKFPWRSWLIITLWVVWLGRKGATWRKSSRILTQRSQSHRKWNVKRCNPFLWCVNTFCTAVGVMLFLL